MKVFIAFSALALALAAPRAETSLALATFAIASLQFSGMGTGEIGRALVPPLLIGAASAALRVLLAPGASGHTPWLFEREPRLPLHALSEAALLASRVLGASAVALWLVATTELRGLLGALAWLRAPRAMLEILALAYRYQRVLRHSLERVHAAQALRLGYVGLRRGLDSAGVLVGAVACRAIDQAQVTGEAMRLRGDRGRLWLPAPGPSTARDFSLAAGAAVALGSSALLSWGRPW